MDPLNYHHLHYFMVVAQEGGIAPASRRLGLGRPAISAQIKSLEQSLGVQLLRRVGRGLELTSAGETARRFAERIFEQGRELVEVLHRGQAGPMSLRVGIADVLVKLVAFRLLSPMLREGLVEHLVCREDELASLYSELALGDLDLVLSDAPLPTQLGIRGVSHRLGESGVVFMGRRELVERYAADFPASMNEAPVLLPATGTALRRRLDGWFSKHRLWPDVRAEFDDSALMKAFGKAGEGLFPAPRIVEEEIRQEYGVISLGVVEGVLEEFYAIAREPGRAHPRLEALIEAARAASTRPVGEGGSADAGDRSTRGRARRRDPGDDA